MTPKTPARTRAFACLAAALALGTLPPLAGADSQPGSPLGPEAALRSASTCDGPFPGPYFGCPNLAEGTWRHRLEVQMWGDCMKQDGANDRYHLHLRFHVRPDADPSYQPRLRVWVHWGDGAVTEGVIARDAELVPLHRYSPASPSQDYDLRVRAQVEATNFAFLLTDQADLPKDSVRIVPDDDPGAAVPQVYWGVNANLASRNLGHLFDPGTGLTLGAQWFNWHDPDTASTFRSQAWSDAWGGLSPSSPAHLRERRGAEFDVLPGCFPDNILAVGATVDFPGSSVAVGGNAYAVGAPGRCFGLCPPALLLQSLAASEVDVRAAYGGGATWSTQPVNVVAQGTGPSVNGPVPGLQVVPAQLAALMPACGPGVGPACQPSQPVPVPAGATLLSPGRDQAWVEAEGREHAHVGGGLLGAGQAAAAWVRIEGSVPNVRIAWAATCGYDGAIVWMDLC